MRSPIPTAVVELDQVVDAAGAKLGSVVAASDSFEQLTGQELADLRNHPLCDCFHSEDTGIFELSLGELLDPTVNRHLRVITAWGVMWVGLSTSLMGEGDDLWAVLSFTDMTEVRETEKALAERATHDALTGLPNRALLSEHLDRVLALMSRSPGAVAVVFIDLDGFKHVNDTFGHEEGDEVLRDVALRIRQAVRRHDLVTRQGGDEFVVVCDALVSQGEAAMVAERIRESFATPVEAGNRSHRITASIGVAQTSDPETSSSDLLRRSDLAMYSAKDKGRNRVEFFAAKLESDMKERLRMVDRMRTALESGGALIHLQPVVRLADSEVVGYEALARLQLPDGEIWTPGEFITTAMQTGLVRRLDRETIANAITYLKTVPDSTKWLAINVSIRKLAESHFGAQFLEQLAKADIPVGKIVLELGETAMMEAVGPALITLRELRDSGIRVALDDFGTGLSSPTALREIPVDIIKLDKSFVAGIGVSRADESIVSAVISVTTDMGRTIIAEGVETPAQAEFLRKHDCELAQGHLLGPPSVVGGAS